MTETRQLVIVRRHKLAAFAMLAQAFADEPGVRLTWDRRLHERRKAPVAAGAEERRSRDRRCHSCRSWGSNDYVLVGVTEAIKAAAIVRPDVGLDAHTRASDDIRLDIEAAVRSDLTVLMSGGDPVSRKSLAHQIHRRSSRSGQPFFVVERDAFVKFFRAFDAAVPPPGRIMGTNTWHALRAKGTQGGTLLIEEIANLNWEEQSQLLLFLECGVQRDDRRTHGVRDARLITGTSHWLLDRVAAKQFRADLFYRLNSIHLTLPAGSARTCG